MIENNVIWNQAWLNYSADEKLDALRKVIMDISDHLNAFDDTPAREFVTKDELSNSEQMINATMHSNISDVKSELRQEFMDEIKGVLKKYLN